MPAKMVLVAIQFLGAAIIGAVVASILYYGAGLAGPGKYPPDLIIACVIGGAVLAGVVWGAGRLAASRVAGIERPTSKTLVGTLALGLIASLSMSTLLVQVPARFRINAVESLLLLTLWQIAWPLAGYWLTVATPRGNRLVAAVALLLVPLAGLLLLASGWAPWRPARHVVDPVTVVEVLTQACLKPGAAREGMLAFARAHGARVPDNPAAPVLISTVTYGGQVFHLSHHGPSRNNPNNVCQANLDGESGAPHEALLAQIRASLDRLPSAPRLQLGTRPDSGYAISDQMRVESYRLAGPAVLLSLTVAVNHGDVTKVAVSWRR